MAATLFYILAVCTRFSVSPKYNFANRPKNTLLRTSKTEVLSNVFMGPFCLYKTCTLRLTTGLFLITQWKMRPPHPFRGPLPLICPRLNLLYSGGIFRNSSPAIRFNRDISPVNRSKYTLPVSRSRKESSAHSPAVSPETFSGSG